MTLLLSPSEIAELTGIKKKRPLQQQWLVEHNIPFTLKYTGELNVLRSAVEQRHSNAPAPRATSPNYAALEVHHGKAQAVRTRPSC